MEKKMLTSFIADESWINDISQMISPSERVKHYKYVELFTHKKLLIIDLVSFEHDEELQEEISHHRKIITSDTTSALKLISEGALKNTSVSSLGFIQLCGDNEVIYKACSVKKIYLQHGNDGLTFFEYHFQDGRRFKDNYHFLLPDLPSTGTLLFSDNNLTPDYFRVLGGNKVA